jgi:Uma2 family endonuclease
MVAMDMAWPEVGEPFTVADLNRLPDDGRRYELLDGVLIVGPHSTTLHQLAVGMLATQLSNSCPDGLCAVTAPAVQVNQDTKFVPDIVVVPVSDVGGAKFNNAPPLAVEIRSPRTAIVDRNAKLAAYERFGVVSYWIFDPSPQRPELTVFELRDGRYEQTAQASGTDTLRVERPFAVELAPARLTLSPS